MSQQLKFVRQCIDCQTKFEVKNHSVWARKKYCPDCKKKRVKKYAKKYSEENRELLKLKAKERRLKKKEQLKIAS